MTVTQSNPIKMDTNGGHGMCACVKSGLNVEKT